ncbi:AMP-binding protein [Streptomyces sp. HNM0574]|uniref:AMP-binding protein n=1 Tax=Streptomyces sp. HNM0574 TaxID=2714954 RepID=UPI00146F7F22|nr:AMP-binding protein [Streptomyces sp. HNM0574]NLU70933.1 4-coumarate--CoA ligase family protein [Streptomyces sp. HNM0574]
MVFRSEYADVPVVDLPIHEAVLGRSAAEHGTRPALVDGRDGTSVSYAQLDDRARRIAAALTEAGLERGDVLALHSPNSTDFPAVFYGATRAGAVVTLVHPLATPGELARQLGDSGARWIVTVSPLLDTVRAATAEGGRGGAPSGIREIFVCDRAEGYRSVRDLWESTAPVPRLAVDPGEVAVLPYSSGTTAAPKGVMLTHRSIATNLAQLEPLVPSGPGDTVLAVLPFFHIYGLTALMNAPLRTGATVVVLPSFDLDTFLGAIEQHRVNAVYVAPPIVLALAKHAAVDRYDLSSLEYLVSAAAPLDAGLAGACARRLGLKTVLQAYGMTELSPGTHVVPRAAENPPPGTVGKLLPGTEMRVVAVAEDGAVRSGVLGDSVLARDPGLDLAGDLVTDHAGQPGEPSAGPARRDLGPGEEGELLFRGPQVMKGYLGRAGETAAMVDEDGWLRTGDVGRVDEDGWLFVVDRVKELIKYKGYQVAPADLEAVLLTHREIADAAVIGVQDAEGNEVPKAFVVRGAAGTDGPPLGAADVLEYVAARVAPYKKVRLVEFVDAVPRAASGKILRRELRDREAASRHTH